MESQICCDLLLRITMLQIRPGDCPVSHRFSLAAGEEAIKRGAYGESLDARDLRNGDFRNQKTRPVSIAPEVIFSSLDMKEKTNRMRRVVGAAL